MIGKEFKNKKGQNFRVLSKSNNKSSSGNYKWNILFLESGNEYEVNKASILNGSIYDKLYEEQKFISGIYPQKCGDSLKIIRKTNNKIGSTFLYECEFLKYPYKIQQSKYHILEGCVFNPWVPQGKLGRIIGEGKYNIEENKECFNKWNHLILRCTPSSATYTNSEICDEWKCFQNFAIWYEENIKKYTRKYKLELDKDILYNINHLKGPKIYSPNTCLLIPGILNGFITDGPNTGVFLKRYKYEVSIHKEYVGSFDTFKEAKLVYANLKYKYWKIEIDKCHLPNDIKEILLQYDFSWSWIWENMTEEEILKEFYKIDKNEEKDKLVDYLKNKFNIEISYSDYINIKSIFEIKC